MPVIITGRRLAGPRLPRARGCVARGEHERGGEGGGGEFPYGYLAKVHPPWLLAAEVRAGRLEYRDIKDAAIRLRDMMDEMAH